MVRKRRLDIQFKLYLLLAFHGLYLTQNSFHNILSSTFQQCGTFIPHQTLSSSPRMSDFLSLDWLVGDDINSAHAHGNQSF